MTRNGFRFFDRQRVRWAEVDMQKVVFNGHYLMYFDTGIAGYWRALAMPYRDTMAYLGGDLFMRKASVEYAAAARYDEMLDIGLRCERIGNSSINFSAAVFRGEQRLVQGELVYVFADPSAQASKPVPQELRDVLQAFEAGRPMVQVRVGTWDELGRDAQRIRGEVFIEEQRIPAQMEWDGADPSCTHAVAYNRIGTPLATGRLLEHVPGVAKIGRMAVSQAMRGGRIGRAVLDALMEAARGQGFREAVLHAQVSALAFYLRAGFAERGPRFEEAGIAHQEMARTL